MDRLYKKKWKTRVIPVIMVSLLIIFSVLFSLGIQSKEIPIIPKPLSYEKGKGQFILTENTSIYIKGKTETETEEIYRIAQFLRNTLKPSTGFDLDIIKSDNVSEGSVYLTTIGGKESQGSEGYTINSTAEYIKLTAYAPEGLARGIQTLRQLLPADIEKSSLVTDTKWSIDAATINDQPEYRYRGLLIDVARHFIPVEDIKRQIDFAAHYKINKLHLHLSDDQGWRLEIKKWPELTTIGGSTAVGGGTGGYYTQEQFKEIVKYANERYIEVIPEIDMPGHSNAALASYGFLNEDGVKKPLYTGIEVGFSTLMCRDEKTYEFVEDIIKEIAEVSPSKYIHIGGDEPNSTQKSDYDYFVGRVSKIVEKYGKTPIGWDPYDTSKDVSSKYILQNWTDKNKAAKDKGMMMIISPSKKAYLDMKYDNTTPYGLTWAGNTSIEDGYKWDPTQYAPKELVIGVEAAMWTETIDESKMDYMIYPRLLGHAEIGWTPKEARNWRNYKSRLIPHGERLENQGINYYKDSNIWKIK